jgi:hypothetical protein
MLGKLRATGRKRRDDVNIVNDAAMPRMGDEITPPFGVAMQLFPRVQKNIDVNSD